ncbi:MAG TPA: hypothetical protein VIH27_06535 [Nitrososphaerales archaeon]
MLGRDLYHLKEMLVPESEPERDEISAVKAGRREFRAKQYVEWSKVKKHI